MCHWPAGADSRPLELSELDFPVGVAQVWDVRPHYALMKFMLPVALLTAILYGCKPAPETGAPKTPETVQATNSETVTGGFGWTLGEIIPTNQDLSYETNGQFSTIYLFVSTNRELYAITGCTPLKSKLQPDDLKALLKALADKYGYWGSAPVDSGVGYVFGAPNSVVVYDYEDLTEISYKSPLATEVRKQQEDAAVKSYKNY
jgi:hypothetical protein